MCGMKRLLMFVVTIIILSLVVHTKATSITRPKINTEATRPPVLTTTRLTPEERRKFALYPKNPSRFIVTPKYKTFTANSTTITATKIPTIMPQVERVMKTETSTIKNKIQKGLRQRVMQLKAITTTQSALNDNINIEKARKVKRIKLSKSQSVVSTEDIADDVEVQANNNKPKIKITVVDAITNVLTMRPDPYVTKNNAENYTHDEEINIRDKRLTDKEPMPDFNKNIFLNKFPIVNDTILNEKADAEEFIFINTLVARNFGQFKNKLDEFELQRKEQSTINEDNDLDVAEAETVTEITQDESQSRLKRNIIEEEISASTTSGFHVTEQDLSLKHGISYKNINV